MQYKAMMNNTYHTKKQKLLNALLYQLGWGICIFVYNDWLCVAASIIVVSIYLQVVMRKRDEFIFIIIVATLGYAGDHLCQFLGFIELTVTNRTSLYLLSLWIMFSTTLRSSFGFTMQKWYYASGVGILAPLAYIAAEKFDKVMYQNLASIAGHALLWASVMFISYKINQALFPSISDPK